MLIAYYQNVKSIIDLHYEDLLFQDFQVLYFKTDKI